MLSAEPIREDVATTAAPRPALNRLDLNLLLAFDALMTERNVTRAAKRMSVGQPAMSTTLARLRRAFGDPLLVRRGRSLEPTALALDLIGPIRDALDTIESAVSGRSQFDPSTDHRTFTIMASDYVLLLLLTRLLEELTYEAPNVQINIVPHVGEYEEHLAQSRIDLLILPREITTLATTMRSAELFTDRFVCAIDKQHPEVDTLMTEEQFRTLPYIAYHTSPLVSAPEKQLRSRGVKRPVEVATQSFIVLPLMLTGTRFFALAHRLLVDQLADQVGIRWVEPPFALDPITEMMFWTERTESDPAHQWLRERIREASLRLKPCGHQSR